MEAFKPDEEPDDAYSVIGFTGSAESGGAPADDDAYYRPPPPAATGPTFGSGRGGLW